MNEKAVVTVVCCCSCSCIYNICKNVVMTLLTSDVYSNKLMHEFKQMFVSHVMKFLPGLSEILH